MLVFPAGPHRKADARRGQLLRVAAERQPLAAEVDVDDPLARGRADVGVRRQGKAGVQVPAPPRPDRGEEAAHVGGHRRGRIAGQDALEVPARQRVLPLEEERSGQLQAHPHQLGAVDQHGAERGDGLVQQRLPVGFRQAGPARRADRGEAHLEEDIGIDRAAPGQRTQDGQGLAVAALPHQGAGIPGAGLGGAARGGRRRVLLGQGRRGEQEAGRGGHDARHDGERPHAAFARHPGASRAGQKDRTTPISATVRS